MYAKEAAYLGEPPEVLLERSKRQANCEPSLDTELAARALELKAQRDKQQQERGERESTQLSAMQAVSKGLAIADGAPTKPTAKELVESEQANSASHNTEWEAFMRLPGGHYLLGFFVGFSVFRMLIAIIIGVLERL